MSSATVRINNHTHEMLRELAASTGESMQTIVERAVEDYSRRCFLEEANRAYAELQRNPEAWRAEVDERALWDNTLQDGLGEKP